MVVVTLIGITKKTGGKWRKNQNHTMSIDDDGMGVDITEDNVIEIIKSKYQEKILLDDKSKIKIVVNTKTRNK